MAAVSRETLLEWYRQMVLIRQFETQCDVLYKEKKITGVYLHLYSGHEATGVGAVATLRPTDHVITAYRDHGIALARGMHPNAAMAEMMGKRTGCSGGKGGSMHLAQRDLNFWGGYAIVAGHLPLAAGIALESRYNGKDDVVLCFIGDGATNNGYFHEALNLSGVWDLPVVWLIENNGYGMGTPVEVASAQPELVKRAIGYGMKEGPRVDGQDVIAVYEAVSEAVDYARQHGPVLLESLTYRYKGHGVSDRSYDKMSELRDWQQRDPILILQRKLVEMFPDVEPELAQIERDAAKTVHDAVIFAEDSPAPTYEDLIRHVYVED